MYLCTLRLPQTQWVHTNVGCGRFWVISTITVLRVDLTLTLLNRMSESERNRLAMKGSKRPSDFTAFVAYSPMWSLSQVTLATNDVNA